jgi:hypothetical protein
VRGDIISDWQRVSPTEFRLACTIPGNTTAIIHMPLDGMKDVTIREGTTPLWTNGTASSNRPGVTFVSANSRHVRFQVGSGTYNFTATGTAVPLPPLTVICDNDKPAVTFAGNWVNNTINETDQRYERGFEYTPSGDGSGTATFRPNLPTGGRYKVFARWTTHANRATNAPYTIHHANGQETIRVNQEENGGKWMLLGEYDFAPGTAGHVVLSNDADEFVIADAVAFVPKATALPQGASIQLLDDSFDTAGIALNINDSLGTRQTGLFAPATFRSNADNADWQSQVGNSTPTLLLAATPGQPAAGETLDMDLAPACGGRLIVAISLRCSGHNGDSTRWSSLALSNQPPSGNPLVNNVSHTPGILFRANGGIQCFRPGELPDSPSALWTADSSLTKTLKLVISDTAGSGSPFVGNGSLARLLDENETLLAEWPLAQLHQGWLHFGAYESLWEIDDLRISTEVPSTDYQNWLGDNFPGETDPAITGSDADPDSDGLTNFSEYAFGLNPADGSSVNPIVVPFVHATGGFSYTRRLAAASGLSYSVWYSTDLSTWTEDAGAVPGTPSVSGGIETVPVAISSELLSESMLFLRVKASQAPVSEA